MLRWTGPITVLLSLTVGQCAFAQSRMKITLLADTQVVQPGQPFTVAARLTIDPTFHVYWSNPGDSGRATHVRWHLPSGYSAGELQFPAPSRISLPGGLVNFGYEKEVVLMTTIRPPARIEDQPKLTADVDYLVCDENSCKPGEANELGLVLPSNDSERQVIESWKKQLPVPAEKCEDVVRVTPVTGGLDIQWRATPKAIECFPNLDESWQLEDCRVDTTGMNTRVLYRLLSGKVKSLSNSPKPLVLAYTLENGQRRAIELPMNPMPGNP